MATVTANSWIKKPGGAAPFGVLAPYLASIAYGDSGGRREYPLAEPLGTVTVGGIQHAVIAPVLTYAQQGGANRDARDPHHTICASKKDQNSLIAATMVHVGNGDRAGQHPWALDIGAPLNTVVATGVKQYPVAAFFAKYYGTGDGARMGDPCHTVTVKDRMAHMQAELAAPPFAPEHEARARAVAEFLRAHDAWDGGEFVTLKIDGVTYVVIDIGMRMLTPRELFRAQGFPDGYVIEGVWEGLDSDEPQWRAFAKDVQVSCCGSSVCPTLAEAIVAANCQHLVVSQRREAQA